MDNNIIIFKTEDEQVRVDVRFYNELTRWQNFLKEINRPFLAI